MKSLFYIIIAGSLFACSLGEKTTKNMDNLAKNESSVNQEKIELKSPVGMAFGFYNVENLFDTIDDKYTIDEQFLPDSEKKWNSEKYNEKQENLAKVIAAFDSELPLFLGFAEIENKLVLEDLISQKKLQRGNYGIVHTESPDKRGIDVGLIYQKDYMKILNSENLEVSLQSDPDFATRDILYVQAELKNQDEIHVFLNHWSSRRGGEKETEHKRVKAASVLRAKVDEILNTNSMAKIIILGDFNDHPTNKSIYETLNAKGTPDFQNGQLFNMAYKLEKENKGSYNYKGDWGMLDQMIVSEGLYSAEKGVKVAYDKCLVLQKEWMMYTDKKYGDKKPSRSYGGPNYYGGYSDHLPIYSIFN